MLWSPEGYRDFVLAGVGAAQMSAFIVLHRLPLAIKCVMEVNDSGLSSR